MRERPNDLELSTFFPCYNDAGTIASMVVLAQMAAAELTPNYEVVVIDDGSTDHSRAILYFLRQKYPNLRLVFHERNKGYGGALRSGFAACRGQWIFYTDGDFQYDVTELKVLWKKKGENVDIVNGYKIKRRDPFYRVLIGLAYQYFIKVVFGLQIRDVDCDFRLIRRSSLRRFTLTKNSGVICVELVKKLQVTGARFAEVGVQHMFRACGHSQFFNFPRLWRVVRDLAALWWELVVRKDITR